MHEGYTVAHAWDIMMIAHDCCMMDIDLCGQRMHLGLLDYAML